MQTSAFVVVVTDVSWNFRVKKTIRKFKPRPAAAPDGTWRVAQKDVDRVQEFRSALSASCARTSVTCGRRWCGRGQG